MFVLKLETFQLDIEMSFVQREGIVQLIEEMLAYSWPEHVPPIVTPFPHITYEQAMRLYGSDKPDTRFNLKVDVLYSFHSTSLGYSLGISTIT